MYFSLQENVLEALAIWIITFTCYTACFSFTGQNFTNYTPKTRLL